mgnify:CR=1 FL=1
MAQRRFRRAGQDQRPDRIVERHRLGQRRAALDPGEPSSVYLLLAAALYLIGVVAVTVAYHVPRNDRLGALDPESAQGIAYWGVYLREWVRMNHVRTLASLVAAVLYITALQVG